MPFMDVNPVSVVIAAVAYMVLGFLWYSTLLFGKQWMSLSGIDPKNTNKKEMNKIMIFSAVGSLLTAFILSQVLGYFQVQTAYEALVVCFWIWIGFIATAKFNDVLYTKKPFKLFLIDSGYLFAGLVVMSLILINIV